MAIRYYSICGIPQIPIQLFVNFLFGDKWRKQYKILKVQMWRLFKASRASSLPSWFWFFWHFFLQFFCLFLTLYIKVIKLFISQYVEIFFENPNLQWVKIISESSIYNGLKIFWSDPNSQWVAQISEVSIHNGLKSFFWRNQDSQWVEQLFVNYSFLFLSWAWPLLGINLPIYQLRTKHQSWFQFSRTGF